MNVKTKKTPSLETAKKTSTTRRKTATPPRNTPTIATKVAKSPTGNVLGELKLLAKNLTKAATALEKKASGDPKRVATILGDVERMTAEAATKSLIEAESAKNLLTNVLSSLSGNWARRDIETALRESSDHLTNIMVAQEFQDLAGRALRKAMKALVGALVIDSAHPSDEPRLSQKDIDILLDSLLRH